MKTRLRMAVAAAVMAALGACSSTPDKPKPAELPPPAALLATQLVWQAQVGAVPAGVAPVTVRDKVYVAGAANAVVALDAETGREQWRQVLDAPIAAGLGSDGDTVAVVTRNNDLVALGSSGERWRVRLNASAYTAPLVAGRRVFVVTADRTVLAFDGQTGQRLWSQSRPGEPLVLSRPGVLLAVGDTLVTGLAGRLMGLNPNNGSARWEAAVATARGTNEVERLVDLVGPAARLGNNVCVRAYASAVACIEAVRGGVVWRENALGHVGLGGDDKLVFGAESDGRVRAWQRASGEAAWSIDRLQYRELGAPTALGRVIALGDGGGQVFLLSREDGSEMARLSTDGSAVVGAPLLSGTTLMVQTRNGGVFAWRPQ